MAAKILITGGAGFVGSHVADELLNHGYTVRALDNLMPQVHGDLAERPSYLSDEVELIQGDIRDATVVRRALEGIDAVYHFASAVGVGQSMYEIENYTSVNMVGTAVLLEELVKSSVSRLVFASSMSIFGEGLYRCRDGSFFEGQERSLDKLRAHQWELYDSEGQLLTPIPTPETKGVSLASVYAISKYHQERMCMVVGRAYGIPTVGLRFFNIYGTRQALSNPYTGVLAIFGSRFLNNQRPLINEDGNQRRDFVSVHDVAQACRLALENPAAADQVFNIGSGCHYSVRQIAALMAETLDKEHLEPEITGRYRMGDIRHCFADISLARKVLGYVPRVTLRQGLEDLSEWLENQTAVDRVDYASSELVSRGLSI